MKLPKHFGSEALCRILPAAAERSNAGDVLPCPRSPSPIANDLAPRSAASLTIIEDFWCRTRAGRGDRSRHQPVARRASDQYDQLLAFEDGGPHAIGIVIEATRATARPSPFATTPSPSIRRRPETLISIWIIDDRPIGGLGIRHRAWR